jgi:hypothetical protein
VQDEGRQVVSPRLHAVEFVIEHKGQPRKRVPVAERVRSEGPFDVFPRQAAIELPVSGDIRFVVKRYETVI